MVSDLGFKGVLGRGVRQGNEAERMLRHWTVWVLIVRGKMRRVGLGVEMWWWV